MVSDQTAPACTFAIFGAVGDLTKRLLIPSVYDLVTAGLLDPGMRFIGLDHNDRTTESWRSEIGDALHEFAGEKSSEFQAGKIDEKAWSFISERMDFIRLDFTDDDAYRELAAKLADTGNILFYLAVAPHFFEPISSGLAKAGLLAEKDGAFRRLVIEKPFGNDLESARRLNDHLTQIAGEDQLFRIDHFLGKEAVQGIPALRFANRAFRPLFHRDMIASVQITAAETVGVEERGSFYESIGALRDMIPNHLFSLLTLIAMEAPKTYSADDVRDAKAALLGAIRPITAASAVRGQYTAGTSDGAAVRGYREEDNVDRESRTETYAALTVNIENERWRGVPFYLRTGKRMSAHVTTIVLTLRATDGPLDASATGPELLVFGIDPQRGFVQRFAAKHPGVDLRLGAAEATWEYRKAFDEPPNVGYEALLYHAIRGDALLFQRDDMIELEWTALEPLLAAWGADAHAPDFYAAGTDGPPSADAMLARNGDRWYGLT